MTSPQPLPRSGPLPKLTIEEAALALKNEAITAPSVDSITFHATEFTSVCPRTGQPDHGTVTVTYSPNAKALESKSLKVYLWAYRDRGSFCEQIAASIADDVAAAINPRTLTVTVTQNTRGGIALTATATR